MKIKHKLVLGTCLLALLLGGVGWYAVWVGQRALLRSIAQNSTHMAVRVLDEISATIHKSVDEWRDYSDNALLLDTVRASNCRFQDRPDGKALVDQEDARWRSAPSDQPTSLLQDLLGNALSQELKWRIRAINEHEGDDVYGEVFVTNRYGANVAQTSRTSDYRQDDELWWQRAMSDGVYVGRLEYDESAASYSVDVCVRVGDPKDNSLGVIKAVLNVKALVEVLEHWVSFTEPTASGTGHNRALVLLDFDNRIIHSTRDPTIDVGAGVMYEQQFIVKHRGRRTFSFEREDQMHGWILGCGAFSKGSQWPDGLGWILVVEFAAEEALAPVVTLRKSILLFSLITSALGLAVAGVFAFSLSRRLSSVRHVASEFGKGNLNVRIEDNSFDEIGQIARCFNEMGAALTQESHQMMDHAFGLVSKNDALRELNRARDREISERKRAEEELQQNNRELGEANRRLEVMVSNTTEREKRMVLLKKEVNELRQKIGQDPKYSAPQQVIEQGLEPALVD